MQNCVASITKNYETFRISLIYDFVKPLKIWANLDIFFIVSKGGPKEECWKIANWFFELVVEMSSNFERLHEIINQAYPESFIILSWKTPKWVNCRHPYLRKLFPFLKLYILGPLTPLMSSNIEIWWPLNELSLLLHFFSRTWR